MAAPAEMTIKAMSGKFLLNRTLSDSLDEVLQLQGVSWVTRRGFNMVNVVLSMSSTTDETGIEHVHIDKKVSGGLSVTLPSESRALDWVERDEDDKIFGHVTKKGRRASVEEMIDEYLKTGWTQDTLDDGVVLNESWNTPDKNKNKWKLVQAFGFATVNGERRYVGLSTFTCDKRQDPIHTRFVYDYLGPI